jgi:hypothetical protein
VMTAENAEIVVDGEVANQEFSSGDSDGEADGNPAGSESREARLQLDTLTNEKLEQRWNQAIEHMDRTVRMADDQTLRVRVDSELALEVALKGAGVDVMLEGSRQAIESMGDVKGDLKDALSQGGSELGGFESRHSDLSEWDERQQRQGADSGESSDAQGGLVSRIVRRGQLVDTVA